MKNLKITWKSEKRKLSELKGWERNPRQATEKETEDLTKSLNRFNLADPIIINTDGTIIGGHFRYRILKKKGIKEVDVRIPERELNEKEVEELNIRLNKNLGHWDYDLLANFDQDLLLDVGFGEEELMMEFGLNEVEEIDVDEERLDILTVEMPEAVRLKARQSFYCDGVDEFNKIKDFFKTSKVGILDKDKLLKVIDND